MLCSARGSPRCRLQAHCKSVWAEPLSESKLGHICDTAHLLPLELPPVDLNKPVRVACRLVAYTVEREHRRVVVLVRDAQFPASWADTLKPQEGS